jgi:hypothetical protein
VAVDRDRGDLFADNACDIYSDREGSGDFLSDEPCCLWFAEDRSRLVARQWRRAEARPSNGSLAVEERGNRKIASGISGAIAPSANRQKPGAGERRRVRERLSSAQARHRAFAAATAVETPKFLPNRELTDFEHAAHAVWRARDRRRAELSRARGPFGGATIGSHIAIRRSTVPRHRLSPDRVLSVTPRA